jgi:hypothetical protein
MKEFSRERLTLDEAMQVVGAAWNGSTPFIAYDPKVKPQYVIRRASKHDGTFVFSKELMLKALMPLFEKSSFFIPDGYAPNGMEMRYTVGRIKRFSVYGKVRVPVGMILGQRECVLVPVRYRFVKAEGQHE